MWQIFSADGIRFDNYQVYECPQSICKCPQLIRECLQMIPPHFYGSRNKHTCGQVAVLEGKMCGSTAEDPCWCSAFKMIRN